MLNRYMLNIVTVGGGVEAPPPPSFLSTPTITHQNGQYLATVTTGNLPDGVSVILYANNTPYPMTLINGIWAAELPLSPGTWSIYAEATDGVDTWQSDTLIYVVDAPPIPDRIITALPTQQSGLTYKHRRRIQYLRDNDIVAAQYIAPDSAVVKSLGLATLESGDRTDGIWAVQQSVMATGRGYVRFGIKPMGVS